MGSSFTPELIRLLREAGCKFERPGKGDHEYLVFSHHRRALPRRPQNQVTSYRERGAQTGWFTEGVLKLSCLTLNPTKSHLTIEWAIEHREELMEDWNLCQSKQHPKRIKPLE